MPDLDVYRPCDIIETAECWQLALDRADGPSLLALTRQNWPQWRDGGEMLSARGAYRLRGAKAARQVVLIAAGSEVEIACGVAERLEAEGIGAGVGWRPCASRFDAQPDEYRADVLPGGVLRVSIEAGTGSEEQTSEIQSLMGHAYAV